MKRQHISALILLLACSGAGTAIAQTAPSKSAGFPIPQHMLSIADVVTPAEYAGVVAAIQREIAMPAVSKELDEGPGLGPLDLISATRVMLGSLGDGIVVDFAHAPSCGNGGCPMWLLLSGPHGYRVAIKSGGWGYTLVNTAGSVPDIAFYWQMGAGETDVSQYHYSRSKFVPVAAKPPKCGDEDDKRGVCAGRAANDAVRTITPAQYDSLPQGVKAAQSFSDHAHAFDLQMVNDKIARVVGVGACTRDGDCQISIYGCKESYPRPGSSDLANVAHCEYWPMLTGVSGWGVANVSDWTTDPFSPRVALVVVRRVSSSEAELIRYSMASSSAGPEPGKALLPDACEVVAVKNGKWKSEWDARDLTVETKACGNFALPEAAHVRR
jgi:hypothetical protein